MQFNSIQFIFFFLPIFLAIYYVLPLKWRNPLLLVGSIVFYWMNARQAPFALTLLIVLLTAYAYFIGIMIRKRKDPFIFWASLVFLVGLMVFFKAFSGGVLLPVGFSYYMFQISAYLIAVYRRRMDPEEDPIALGCQVIMFPKILIGPIAEPVSLQQETHRREHKAVTFHEGLQLFIVGLAMQVLLGNRIHGLWYQASVVGYESISVLYAWLALLGFTMNLYFNFYGCSLMAKGIGLMMGFRLPDNFDTPYASRSVAEFYRRWHISLGAWFRENVYIPMGGNRGGTVKTIINLLVVWLLTGLWHGVGGNYLLWAGILVFFIILERLWLRKWLEKYRILSHIYTVLVILLSWVPFAIGDWSQMMTFYGRLIGIGGRTINPGDYMSQLQMYGKLIIAGIVMATPLPKWVFHKIRKNWIADVLLFVLFWIVVYFIASSAQDPFTYY